MKRKCILIVAITVGLLFGVGILIMLKVNIKSIKSGEEGKESQKPSWERFEEEVRAEEAAEAERAYRYKKKDILEKENCVIDGKKYEKIVYTTRKGVGVVFAAKMKGDKLIFPSEIDGVKVTKIGGFLDCESEVDDDLQVESYWENKLEEVVIPEGVTHMNDYALEGLKAEKVVFPSTLQKLGRSFVDGKVDEVIIKSATTELEFQAFSNSGLQKISFPKDYAGIFDSSAFSYTSIKEIHWPDGGKVEGSAFYYCKDLEKVVFPENQKVIRIPELAFWRCDNLKELVFPASTGKVIIENNVSAENTLGNSMPPVLRFEGKDTKLQGLKKKVKGKDLVMTQKIIAPKGSEAIKYAKKAYRLKRVSDKKSVRKSIKDYADGNGVLYWWDKREKAASGVEFAPLLYEEVG